ncbi:hypothetical protein LZ31DRAFT_592282 [Colletotrichum somersetense]|nr:hypothetical protein LZ31DRAFT_592282 [Colletotrichum somersetense]
MRLAHILTFSAMVLVTLMTGVQCDPAKKDPDGPSCLNPKVVKCGSTQKYFELHSKTEEFEQAIQQRINNQQSVIDNLKVLSTVKSFSSALDLLRPSPCPYKPLPYDLILEENRNVDLKDNLKDNRNHQNNDHNDNQNDDQKDNHNGGTNPTLLDFLERIAKAQEKKPEEDTNSDVKALEYRKNKAQALETLSATLDTSAAVIETQLNTYNIPDIQKRLTDMLARVDVLNVPAIEQS